MKLFLKTILFLSISFPCYGMDFCEFLDEAQRIYCPTTTTSMPAPEYCGVISLEEANDLIESYKTTLWDREYRLITINSLKEFLKHNKIKYQGKWFDCDDYCKVMLGKVMMWAPGVAFGIAHIINDEGTFSHATNFLIDCDKNVWRIEPQGNGVTPWDEKSHFILLREGEPK